MYGMAVLTNRRTRRAIEMFIVVAVLTVLAILAQPQAAL